jgi:hypothetical protein
VCKNNKISVIKLKNLMMKRALSIGLTKLKKAPSITSLALMAGLIATDA